MQHASLHNDLWNPLILKRLHHMSCSRSLLPQARFLPVHQLKAGTCKRSMAAELLLSWLIFSSTVMLVTKANTLRSTGRLTSCQGKRSSKPSARSTDLDTLTVLSAHRMRCCKATDFRVVPVTQRAGGYASNL